MRTCTVTECRNEKIDSAWVSGTRITPALRNQYARVVFYPVRHLLRSCISRALNERSEKSANTRSVLFVSRHFPGSRARAHAHPLCHEIGKRENSQTARCYPRRKKPEGNRPPGPFSCKFDDRIDEFFSSSRWWARSTEFHRRKLPVFHYSSSLKKNASITSVRYNGSITGYQF